MEKEQDVSKIIDFAYILSKCFCSIVMLLFWNSEVSCQLVFLGQKHLEQVPVRQNCSVKNFLSVDDIHAFLQVVVGRSVAYSLAAQVIHTFVALV